MYVKISEYREQYNEDRCLHNCIWQNCPQHKHHSSNLVTLLVLGNAPGGFKPFWVIRENIPRKIAKKICSDKRTQGKSFFLGYMDMEYLKDTSRGYYIKDDGRFDDIINEYI